MPKGTCLMLRRQTHMELPVVLQENTLRSFYHVCELVALQLEGIPADRNSGKVCRQYSTMIPQDGKRQTYP